MIKYAELHREYLECKDEIDQAIAYTIAKSNFINGEAVERFEEQWAKSSNTESAAGTSSGTSALMLALASLDIGIGDEVIVPTMSFISTAEVVSQLRATPVFVDIDEYHTLDLSKVQEKITAATKAIIFVDLYGQTIDIAKLHTISRGIPLIRDAAQSAGCMYIPDDANKYVYATCFSFYPGKNLSAMGDAGAVSGSRDLCRRIRMLRDHGRIEKYEHLIVGWCERLDAIQAAILSAKINKLASWNCRRQSNARHFIDGLDKSRIDLPATNPCSTHVYNQFVVTCEDRDQLRCFLADKKIETGIQFPKTMHKQPVYSSSVSLPKAERLAETCLSLPVHPYLSSEDLEMIVTAINEFYARN